MDEWLKLIKDNWNETADSDWYQSLRTEEKIEELVKEPANAFHSAVHQLINKYMPDLHEKKVLLPSSGDNHAALSLACAGFGKCDDMCTAVYKENGRITGCKCFIF